MDFIVNKYGSLIFIIGLTNDFEGKLVYEGVISLYDEKRCMHRSQVYTWCNIEDVLIKEEYIT